MGFVKISQSTIIAQILARITVIVWVTDNAIVIMDTLRNLTVLLVLLLTLTIAGINALLIKESK